MRRFALSMLPLVEARDRKAQHIIDELRSYRGFGSQAAFARYD